MLSQSTGSHVSYSFFKSWILLEPFICVSTCPALSNHETLMSFLNWIFCAADTISKKSLSYLKLWFDTLSRKMFIILLKTNLICFIYSFNLSNLMTKTVYFCARIMRRDLHIWDKSFYSLSHYETSKLKEDIGTESRGKMSSKLSYV